MARTERQSTSPLHGVTSERLREAERGLRLALRPTYAPAWIARNVRDLLAETNLDYAEWAGEHGPARNPTGWLIEHARLQASKLVARENRRSGPPLESVIHSIEDGDPSPEDAALELDRIRRIEEALLRIPDKDRRLLALVYREGHSVRAAGRLLGWVGTNAHHHNRQAMTNFARCSDPAI